jgi:hypothetical protein
LGIRQSLARHASLIHAGVNVRRSSYLSSADKASGVSGAVPINILPNNSVVELVQMPP